MIGGQRLSLREREFPQVRTTFDFWAVLLTLDSLGDVWTTGECDVMRGWVDWRTLDLGAKKRGKGVRQTSEWGKALHDVCSVKWDQRPKRMGRIMK